MSTPNDKGADESPKAKKPPGYRKFEKLLKQVLNAPPLRKQQAEKSAEARPTQ